MYITYRSYIFSYKLNTIKRMLQNALITLVCILAACHQHVKAMDQAMCTDFTSNSLIRTSPKRFDISRNTCYIATEYLYSWSGAFQFCDGNDDFVIPINHVGRSVHVKGEDIWTALSSISGSSCWMGLRTELLNSTDLDNWMWYPSENPNPNALQPASHFFTPDPSLIYFGYLSGDYAYVHSGSWRGVPESTRLYAICEIFEDFCVSNPCQAPRSECVPEPTTYRCVCPKATVPIGSSSCLPASQEALQDAPYYPHMNGQCGSIQCGVNESCTSAGCVCSLERLWSDCIGHCEYGFKWKDNCQGTMKMFTNCTIASSCTGVQETPVENKVSQLDTECGEGGLFLGSACYKVIENVDNEPLTWEGAFDLCNENGMRLAHFYDGEKTLMTIINYLLNKDPEAEVWMGLKYQNPGAFDWMNSPTERMTEYLGPTTFPGWMNLTTDKCLALSATKMGVWEPGHFDWNNCSQAYEHVNRTLCMKDSNCTRFRITYGRKIVSVGSSIVIGTEDTTDSIQSCGVKCLSRRYCVGYNFGPDKRCELLKVNEDMNPYPQGEDHPAIFKLEASDTAWLGTRV